jgi:hypothetical protein
MRISVLSIHNLRGWSRAFLAKRLGPLKNPRRWYIGLIFGLTTSITAGPEIYDPLEAYKKNNTLSSRPVIETVTQGNTNETAKFKYENNLLVRTDYFGNKNIPAGYSLYEYDKGVLVREQLFDAAGNLTEEIRYQYRKDRLDKSLINDIRGNVRIEWQYTYNKEGKLVAGKRVIANKATESFKIVASPIGVSQHIYNVKGELTSKVESVFENGLLRSRMKTGLTGARYAEYKYNAKQQLIEIIFHETVRGEKTFVKKHHFDYSLNGEPPRTALKTGN